MTIRTGWEKGGSLVRKSWKGRGGAYGVVGDTVNAFVGYFGNSDRSGNLVFPVRS